MQKYCLTLSVFAAAMAVSLSAAPAHAQATGTWVSGVGDDANPCSRTAPCKTFAGAISKTADGGEIRVLDPGGFGAVTITKGITITGDGNLANILAAGTSGIIINNITPGKDVIIRNISINGFGDGTTPGITGIRFLAGNSLTLQNVSIYGFATSCVEVAITSGGPVTHIIDTTLSNCTIGINVSNAAVGQRSSVAMTRGSINNVRADSAQV